MIIATDYEELVFNCQELLTKDFTCVLGEVVATINTNSSYAALTVMALYTAATNLDFPIEKLDSLLLLAEEKCPEDKVREYRRFFVKFKEFENSKYNIHLSNTNFFIPQSNNIH